MLLLAALAAAIVDGAVSSTREKVHRGLPNVGSQAVLIFVTAKSDASNQCQRLGITTLATTGKKDSLRMYGLLVRINSWKTTASAGALWNKTEEG